MSDTTVDVGVCTFRRPGVVDTLRSLGAQQIPDGVRLRVIVADNTSDQEARARVEDLAPSLPIEVRYLHAPERNICIARNACLDAATADFVGFLDDDEQAAPAWLSKMLAEAANGWDAVLGPVRATYQPTAPAWMLEAEPHSTAPVQVGGRILKGYAGNVLIRRAAVEARGLRFDLRLGRQGGEDDDFFYRLTDSGGAIGYAEEAVAFEDVPADRASLAWLLKRSFRTGQTHARRLAQRPSLAMRLRNAVIASGKAGLCSVASATSFTVVRRNKWMLRGALHAGVVSGLAGRKTLEMY